MSFLWGDVELDYEYDEVHGKEIMSWFVICEACHFRTPNGGNKQVVIDIYKRLYDLLDDFSFPPYEKDS